MKKIESNYIASSFEVTYMRNSNRIKISSEHLKKSKIISYDYRFDYTVEVAINAVFGNSENVGKITHAQTKTGYLVISDFKESWEIVNEFFKA